MDFEEIHDTPMTDDELEKLVDETFRNAREKLNEISKKTKNEVKSELRQTLLEINENKRISYTQKRMTEKNNSCCVIL